LGSGALAALAFWTERSRETDWADSRAGVTARSRDEAKEKFGSSQPRVCFRDAAAALGLAMLHGPGPRGRTLPEDMGSGLAWGDYDGDGDWDLYAANCPGSLFGPFDLKAGANCLFRNDGGHFVDVTEQAGRRRSRGLWHGGLLGGL
jgi:hypothetical protein